MKTENNYKNEIIEKLKMLDTTLLADGARGHIAMNHSIKPIDEDMFIAGTAFTARTVEGCSKAVGEALKLVSPGDVLVVDAQGTDYNAVWGDVKSRMALARGVEGVVIDGSARDLKDCREIGFPVFCKYMVVAASKKDCDFEVDIPIECGGIIVNPGDYVVGDLNGVVVIPQNEVEGVIERALLKKEKTEKMIARIEDGDKDIDYR